MTDIQKLLDRVTKKYGPLEQEWVAEKGKVTETRMIKELATMLHSVNKSYADRVDMLNARLYESHTANKKLEKDLAESADKLKEMHSTHVALAIKRRVVECLTDLDINDLMDE